MVRLLKKDNVDLIANLVTAGFTIQQYFTHIVPVNFPECEPCLYAMWHKHQCCIYGFPNKSITNVMVSNSKDGEIVARAIKRAFGFKLVRGSKGRGRGGVAASMQLIEQLKNGENGAIMVDGPRGPKEIVKDGAIKIAKLAGVPIVPVVWYSNNFNLYKLPSWDGLQMPMLDVRLINLYGSPIYVPADGDDESDEKCRLQLQAALKELEKQAPKEYEKVYWHGLWRKKRK